MVGVGAVFLLPLIISTNPSIYGSQEYNETLEYKYATPEEKLQLEFQNLESDCLVSRGGFIRLCNHTNA
jgi:hypothetical protein